MNRLSIRYWEIDFLRGIAIFLMIILHFLVDLSLLQMFQFPFSWTLWFVWQKVTASLFLLLVGICLTISYHRENELNTEKKGKGCLRSILSEDSPFLVLV